MLRRIESIPTDKPVFGAHLVPVMDDGAIVMTWNWEDQMLTTIGGRLEAGESIEQAIRREAKEEAGLELDSIGQPFAAWYWENTDTYTVWFLARVGGFTEMPKGFETTGRVILNFETARQIISQLKHDPGQEARRAILTWAEELTR